MRRAGLLATLFLVAVGAQFNAPEAGAAVPHFDLNKSAPEEGATVSSPTEIRLWFTEEPDEGTTSIRVINGDGEALETGDVTQDAENARSFAVALNGSLAPGQYTVAWRSMGDDGHVVRGDFTFTVADH